MSEQAAQNVTDDVTGVDGTDALKDPPPGRDFEKEARTMGWVPQEDFRGAPDKHIPAQEFVERGEEKIPLLLNNIKRLSAKVDEQTKSIEYQNHHHQEDLKQANERARKEIEDEMLTAVDEGDRETFLNLKKKRDNIKDPEPVKTVSKVPPEFVQFEAENLWYNSDTAMTAVAQAESQRLAKEFPSLSIEQNLARTKAAVEAAFPHKFQKGNPRRDEPGAVGAGKPRGKSTGRTFASLPDDAQQAFEIFHRDKVFGKDISKDDAKKKYISTYQWD
jgi:hypothetical protein